MANVQKTLEALQPYVIGIRYLEGFPVVDAVFKDGWTLPESSLITKTKGDAQMNYYMLFSDKNGVGLDNILEYVDIVIKANIDREKKHDLLKEKVNELKDIFRKNPLAKLTKLKFTFPEESLVPDLDEFDLDEHKEDIVENVPSDTVQFIPPSVSAIESPEVFQQEPLTEEEAEMIEEEKRAENFRKIQEAKKNSANIKKHAPKVELPPKKTIQDAISDPVMPNCGCGPNEACEKCIEFKDY